MKVPVLGVGTVALDSVETPLGSAEDVPGGSALYFGASARHFGPVALVGAMGADFPQETVDALARGGVDVRGLRRHAGESFRWKVRYGPSWSDGETVWTNRAETLGDVPEVPAHLRSPTALFLGSTAPHIQKAVLEQLEAPGLVVLDTMEHWIADRRDELVALLPRVDVLLVSEREAYALGGSRAPSLAARTIRGMGPAWVVVKRGVGGAGAFGVDGEVLVPSRRVETVVDPTGAGDAFAGGFVGTLARSGSLSTTALRGAVEAGVLMGALALSSFSLDALLEVSSSEVHAALSG